MKKYVYLLKDLDCADCANKIQQELSKNESLKNVTVNFNTLKLVYETDILTKEDVEKIVQSLEPEVTLTELNEKSVVKKEKADRSLLDIKDIYDFIKTVELTDIQDILERQIDYNYAIACAGLNDNYGANIGKVLLKSFRLKLSAP